MNYRGASFCVVHFLLLPALYILHVNSRQVPIISFMKIKRDLMNRESVKKLQLQSMLRSLNRKDNEKDEFFTTRLSDNVKRDLDGNLIVNTDFPNLIGDQQDGWDIIKQPVPFETMLKQNAEAFKPKQEDSKNNNEFLEKRANTPCRHKREVFVNKRSLDTPHGEGLVPAYGIYDEMCEDSLPVEVVKIDKLVVEDGVIKDQNIIEKAMFAS